MECNRCHAKDIAEGSKFCPFCYNDLSKNLGFVSKENVTQPKPIEKDPKIYSTEIINKGLKTSVVEEKKDSNVKKKKGILSSLFKKDKPEVLDVPAPEVKIEDQIDVVNPMITLEANLNTEIDNTPIVDEVKVDTPEVVVPKKSIKDFITKKNIIKGSIAVGGLFLLIIGFFIVKNIMLNNREDVTDVSRTIMIYMIGGPIEENYGGASKKIDEIVKSGVDEENINVLIFTGGSNKWTRNIANSKNSIYKVSNGNFVKQTEYEKTSMGEPDTLAKFIQYCFDNYNSDRYSLIIYGSGGGPIYGVGNDTIFNNDALKLSEITKALEMSPFNSKQKLEFIGFDASFMSSIETAGAISKFTNYMIAPEDKMYNYGFDYSFLKSITRNTTTENIGKIIVDNYYNSVKDSLYINNIDFSLSVLDLSDYNTLNDAIITMFSELDGMLESGKFNEISKRRGIINSIGKFSTSKEYDLVDIYSLIDSFEGMNSDTVSGNVKTGINNLIFYQKTNVPMFYGVSTYYPYTNKEEMNSMLTNYNEIGYNITYTSFIKNYTNKLLGESVSAWDTYNLPINNSIDNIMTVELNQDIIDKYSKAYYNIYKKVNSIYTLVYTSNDVSMTDNILMANINKKELLISNAAETIDTNGYLLLNRSSNKTQSYLIPAILVTGNNEEISGYVQFIISGDSPNGKLANVLLKNTSFYDNKDIYKMEDYYEIKFSSISYSMYDAANNYLNGWLNSGTISYTGYQSLNELQALLKDTIDTNEYYGLFEIKDTQGKSYVTNIVKIN